MLTLSFCLSNHLYRSKSAGIFLGGGSKNEYEAFKQDPSNLLPKGMNPIILHPAMGK